MNTGIHKRIAVGAAWSVSLRWIDRVMHITGIAILARLLLPADFGLVAYAMVFLAVLDEFLAFNFGTVLIRDRDSSKENYNTVWTLEVIKGLALAAVIITAAQPVAVFFKEPRVEEILYWFAVVPVLKGLVNVGTVDFERDLTFDKHFYFNATTRLIGTLITIALAWMLRSYWALVYGAIITPVLRIILSYSLSDFRPWFSLTGSSRIIRFSKWLLALNIVNSVNDRLPAIMIGRFFDARALAFFNIANEISRLASVEFAAPIRRALYPGIAKMQDDMSQMAHTLIASLGIIVLVGMPAVVGIGVTAPLFIPLLLGNNWTETTPIIQLLALNAAAVILSSSSHLIYYAVNRPHVTTTISALRMCILVPGILIVVPQNGALGAAWMLAIANWIVLAVDYRVLFHLTSVTLSKVVRVTWRSLIAAIVMGLCVSLILAHPPFALIKQSIFLHLSMCIVTGIATYVLVSLSLWKICGAPEGPESYAIRTAKNLVARFQVAGA